MAQNALANVGRRSHALVGQALLQNDSALMQFKDVCLVVNTNKLFSDTWDKFVHYEVGRSPDELPDRFEDLEDEDHDCEESLPLRYVYMPEEEFR